MNTNKVMGFIAGILIAAGLWWFGFGVSQTRGPVDTDPRPPEKTGAPVETVETPAPVSAETQTPLSGTEPEEKTSALHTPTPDESIPAEAGTASAEAGTADVATPEVITEDAAAPEVMTTDAAAPEGMTADAATPEAMTTDAAAPEVITADAATPEAMTTGAATPETVTAAEMPPTEPTPPMESTLPDTEAPRQEVAVAPAPQKHYIWKPFRLKSKAEGFARHVSAKSSVACEVEKAGVSQYSIFFTYTDEADLAAKRNQIEAIGISLDTTN